MGDGSSNPFVYQLSVDWDSDDRNGSLLRAQERRREIFERFVTSFDINSLYGFGISPRGLGVNLKKRRPLFVIVEDF